MDITILRYPLVTVKRFNNIILQIGKEENMSEQLIPERLTEARKKMNISMAEASRRLNLSKIGYCRYEYGDRVPSPQTVAVIAQCFNTSVDYLVGLSDDPTPSRIILEKSENPLLFEMVHDCQNDGTDMAKRILSYYAQIKAEKCSAKQ